MLLCVLFHLQGIREQIRGGAMSEEPTPQAGSDSPQTASASPKAERRRRSPVERVIVWGGIIVLLLLVGVQAHARFGYESSLKQLQPLVDDERQGGEPLPLAEVDSHLVGFPTQTETKVSDTRTERVYRWRGLGKSYGITLAYNPTIEPVVVTDLVTDNPPVEPEDEEVASAEDAGDASGEPSMPMMMGGGGAPEGHSAGGPGGGGPGGGGGGFNPMANDANGDGKLSREEASERMKEHFDENDTNGDGFIDEAEIAAMRERFRQGGGRGGPGGAGGGGDRPQRPGSDGATAAPAESAPPAESTAPETGSAESTPPDGAPAESTDADKGAGDSAPAETTEAPAESP
jgi:EF hand